MLQFPIAILLGLLAGTITGLIPGIHINLVSVSLLAITPMLLTITSPIYLVIFITSMAITHTFLDFIPSIFLGAPDEDSFLAILPGHELLKKGLGHQAVLLTLYGSLIALPIIIVFIPIFIFIIPKIQQTIISILPFILIFASLYLILREEEFLLSLTIFILAGFIGYTTLNLPVKEPLLPLLTGLFGTSALIVSLKTSSKILIKQKITKTKLSLNKKQILKSSIASTLTAPLCSFLPGIGSGHAAVLASEFSGKTEKNPREFLFLVGSINTIVMALSFITLFSLNRTRSGAAATIKTILKTVTAQNLTLIIITIIISGTLAFFIGIKISKLTAKNIHKINYKTITLTTIAVLLLINLLITNLLGLLVLTTATSLGVFTILSRAKRINLMGSLLIPTIVFYLT